MLNSEDLANAQIRSTEDVAVRTPNLQYSTQQGRALMYMRGVGSSFSLAGSESAVAIYHDGVYLPRQAGSTLALFDIANVQVLRGPQAVLYGRNATGGAIIVETQDPTDRFEGYGEASYGSFDSYRGEAVVNVPLGKTLAVRVAGMVAGNEPWIKNISAPDGGENKERYIRAKLAWQPTDNFKVVLTGEHFRTWGTPLVNFQKENAPCLMCLLYPGVAIPAPGFYTVSSNEREGPFLGNGLRGHGLANKTTAVSLKLNYDADSWSLTSVSSYRDQDVLSRSDNDASAAEFFFARVDEKGPTWTNDTYVRTSFQGPFNFLVGGSFQDLTNHQFAKFSGDAFCGGVPGCSDPTPFQPGQEFTAKVRSISVYGDAWFDITPDVRLTAGARWTRDHKTTHAQNDAEGTIAAGGLSEFRQKKNFTYVTPHVVLSYENGPGYYYVTYAEGVRTGFFSSPTFVPLSPTDSERLKNVEIGAKNSFMGGALRTQVSVFYGRFNNMIVQFNDPEGGGIRAQNAAAAKLYGGELQATYKPTNQLTLTAGAAYLHNHFKSFRNAAVQIPVFSPDLGGVVTVDGTENLSGHVVPRAPKFTGFIGIVHEASLGGDWNVQTAINANYNSKLEFTAGAGGPLRLDKQKGYGLVNASVTLSAPGDRYYVRAFGRYLTKTKYATDAATQSFSVLYVPGMRRVIGVAAGARF